MKKQILQWWNALDADTQEKLAVDYGWAADIDDITITDVVRIYNSENENAFVFETDKPTHGYIGIDKDGQEFWTEDFETAIGE